MNKIWKQAVSFFGIVFLVCTISVWGSGLNTGGSGTATAIQDDLIVDADVNSAANISGSKLADNTVTNSKFQFDALENVKYGTNVLGSLTTGYNNIGVGTGVLSGVTEGYYNIGIGDNVLTSVTTGRYNIAIGRNVLSNVVNGRYNIALGIDTLFWNLTGNSNIALGESALLNNDSGMKNIAIGQEALRDNISGENSIAIGHESSIFSTGSPNTAVGAFSLLSTSTGIHNVAVGHNASYSNTTGDNNVGIGFEADFVNTTGTNNTRVGAYAGSVGMDNLSNATAIGYMANNTASNQVVLGDNNVTDFFFGGQPLSRMELSYLDNVTGNIQGQLDAKLTNLGGSNPTLSTLGQVGVDNTANQLLYYDNAVRVLVPDDSKGTTILAPTATDNVTLYYTKRPITITELDSVITGADNVTWFIRHAATRNSATPDNVVTGGTVTTSASSGTIVTSFDDATIPAGRWVWLQITALGGTPTSIHVTMYFVFDRE